MTTQTLFPYFGQLLYEKIEHSIAELKTYQPDGDYYGCFSGGKDSVVVKALAQLAGVRVRWHYNVTTIDPPEIHRFIRRVHSDVQWNYPAEHFFKMLVRRGYPMRNRRWCCDEFKERDVPAGSVLITGIRASESPRRASKWKPFSRWTRRGQAAAVWMLSPILYWSDDDVWEFIQHHNLPYCELYDEGWKRLGCIGCPVGRLENVQREFKRWPQYERAWRRAFHRLWERRQGDVISRGKRKGRPWPGFPTITNADDLFDWYVSRRPCPDKDDNDCQMGLF